MIALRALALVVLFVRGAAAEVTVQARLEPTNVGVGDAATLSIEINGAQNAAAPDVPAVDGLAVQYLGPSTQISIVNGRMSQSVTHRYSVVATRAGRFTIGPVAVVVDGTRFDAAAVALNATPPGTARPAEAPAGGDQLRLVLTTGKSEVYLHERVPLRLELWVGSVRVSELQYPTIASDGVSIEKLPEQPAQRREGAYDVLSFASTLTPLRTGALTIGPASMGINALVRSRTRDPFFGFFGETQKRVDLRSGTVALSVLPLPEADRPPDFTGAVGRFEMDVKAAPLEVAAGDPVTVTTTIRGAGDLASIAPPTIAASDALRVYPVQPGQPSGTQRTFEQVVIPLHAGTVALPEWRFPYFDPDARAYRTVVQPPIMLAVHAATQPASAPQIVGAPTPRTAPERLGRDLVFIKDDPGRLIPVSSRRYRSALFWAWQVIPLAAWLAAVAYDRRRRRLTGDVRYARFTRAGRAARQALAGAQARLGAGDGGAFYDAVARAMTEYLAAKLDLPPGGVTLETVTERLGRNG
ncbi:MAG TPA: BatD family protein, partial [Candidatus Binatia bacterium]|nr:BatD family protein [Candidatus Binatia bacterium]